LLELWLAGLSGAADVKCDDSCSRVAEGRLDESERGVSGIELAELTAWSGCAGAEQAPNRIGRLIQATKLRATRFPIQTI